MNQGRSAESAARSPSQEPSDDALTALESKALANFGQLAGYLFLAGSLGCVPGTVLFDLGSSSAGVIYGVIALGIASGIACFLIPWHNGKPWWLVALTLIGTAEVFVVTHASAYHYAVLYVLVVAWAAYVFASGPAVALATVLSLVALIGGAIAVHGTAAHALGVALVTAAASVALAATLFRARESAQRERCRAAEMSAEVLRVVIGLQRGHSRVAGSPDEHESALRGVLASVEGFLRALRSSSLRIDFAPDFTVPRRQS